MGRRARPYSSRTSVSASSGISRSVPTGSISPSFFMDTALPAMTNRSEAFSATACCK